MKLKELHNLYIIAKKNSGIEKSLLLNVMIINQEWVKLAINYIKNQWKNLNKSLDDYFNIKPNDNDKVRNAKIQILRNITVTGFIIIIFVFDSIYFRVIKVDNQEGTGFIFFGEVLVFLAWLSIILHKDKKNKRHSH